LISLQIVNLKNAISRDRFPLAIISGGFLVIGDSYGSCAELLASKRYVRGVTEEVVILGCWYRYVAVLYDK